MSGASASSVSGPMGISRQNSASENGSKNASRRVQCVYTMCILPSLQTLQTASVTLFITSRIPFVTLYQYVILYVDFNNKCHSQLSDCSM